MEFQLDTCLVSFKSDLTAIKTMSGNSALIQISKNKSVLFTVENENLEIEKVSF